LLVLPVVIDAEFDRGDYDWIPTTVIGRGWNYSISEFTLNQIRQSSGPDTGGENKNKKREKITTSLQKN
jgi:hypothetical protein